jgi:hypothetical protein
MNKKLKLYQNTTFSHSSLVEERSSSTTSRNAVLSLSVYLHVPFKYPRDIDFLKTILDSFSFIFKTIKDKLASFI